MEIDETEVSRGKQEEIGCLWRNCNLEEPVYIRSNNRVATVLNILRYIGLFLVLAYILIVLIVNKGYQKVSDTIISVAQTKLKGVAYTHNNRTWDVPDYVVPPQENDAFFVTTNAIVTLGQAQGICDENPNIPDALCSSSVDCPQDQPVINGNGVRTGRCMSSTHAPRKVCEIHAWCPVEYGTIPLDKPPLLLASENFTVMIKNWIEFPEFNVKRRNVIEEINDDEYLTSCHYNKSDPLGKYCPVFKLGTIVQEAGENYTDLAMLGGAIVIKIIWDCNLDKGADKCDPQYEFKRLDDKDAQIAKGWNFRHAQYYHENGKSKRDLVKAFGIRFLIEVTGEAAKFDWETMIVDSIGSTISYFALPGTVLFLLIQLMRKRKVYKKFDHVISV